MGSPQSSEESERNREMLAALASLPLPVAPMLRLNPFTPSCHGADPVQTFEQLFIKESGIYPDCQALLHPIIPMLSRAEGGQSHETQITPVLIQVPAAPNVGELDESVEPTVLRSPMLAAFEGATIRYNFTSSTLSPSESRIPLAALSLQNKMLNRPRTSNLSPRPPSRDDCTGPCYTETKSEEAMHKMFRIAEALDLDPSLSQLQ